MYTNRRSFVSSLGAVALATLPRTFAEPLQAEEKPLKNDYLIAADHAHRTSLGGRVGRRSLLHQGQKDRAKSPLPSGSPWYPRCSEVDCWSCVV